MYGPEIIAVFIPIIITLVIGVVLIVHFYLHSKEKQMLIEKVYQQKKSKNSLKKEEMDLDY